MLEVEIMKIMNCPFCGGDDVHCIEGCTMSWVVCGECGAEGPAMFTPLGAVHRWNERIDPEKENESQAGGE